MESKIDKEIAPKKKVGWIELYLVLGLTWALTQNLRRTTNDEVVAVFIILVIGFLYGRIKQKMKSTFSTIIVTEIIAATSMGVLSAIVSRLF